jgi:hypothetical protein
MPNAAPIEGLPMEIVDEIFHQLHLSCNPALRSCLLVKRFWSVRARRFFYRNIVLDNPRGLESFCIFIDREDNSVLVKSLTLRVYPAYWNSKHFPAFTDQICAAFGKLKRLETFSLIGPGFFQWGNIPDNTLASVIDALPEACVNLELDTVGGDSAGLNPESPHLCLRLRRILPRMKRVRLHLRHMCPAMFGEGSVESRYLRESPSVTPEDQDGDRDGNGEQARGHYGPISLPRIESHLLNVGGTYVCDEQVWTGVARASDDYHEYAWIVVCKALEKLVKKDGGGCPASAKLCVLDKAEPSEFDLDEYDTFLCAEARTQVTWAMPHRRCRINEQESSYMVRLPDGRELFGDISVVQGLAEGEIWKTLVGGARLPAALVDEGAATLTDGAPAGTSSDWEEMRRGIDGQVWYNERKAGCRVLEAEKREGPKEYLSRAVIVEDTPRGFHRLTYEALWELHHDDSPPVYM